MKRTLTLLRRSVCLPTCEVLETRIPLAADLPPIVDIQPGAAITFANPTSLTPVGSSVFYRGTKPPRARSYG